MLYCREEELCPARHLGHILYHTEFIQLQQKACFNRHLLSEARFFVILWINQLKKDRVSILCRDSNPVTTVYELAEFLNSKRT